MLRLEAVRITEAPSTRSGSAFCTVKSTPFTLRPNVSSYCRRNGGVELGLATAGYEDACAFRCETLGSSEADTGGAAGHDGYFSFESAYHDLSPQVGGAVRTNLCRHANFQNRNE